MKTPLAIIFCLILNASFAQQYDDEQIKQSILSINLGEGQFKDMNLHPKVFRGLNTEIHYSHQNIKKNISEYSIGLGISLLKTVYEKFPGALSLRIYGDYKHLYPMFSNDRMIYYIGPIIALQYGANGYFNWDDSHLYYANYISGGISNGINLEFGKYRLDFHLDIPMFSIISRPEPNRQYKIDEITFTGVLQNLFSNPEIALPNKNSLLNTGLDLRYETKKMKLRSIGYNFSYHSMQANVGEPYRSIVHNISYKFLF